MAGISSIKTSIAHFLRSNFESARIKGQFLNRVAEILSPRHSFFAESSSSSGPDNKPIGQRSVNVQTQPAWIVTMDDMLDEEAAEKYATEATGGHQAFRDPAPAMEKEREWAEGFYKNKLKSEKSSTKVMTEAIRQMGKEDPARAMALLEVVFADVYAGTLENADDGTKAESLRTFWVTAQSVLENKKTTDHHPQIVLYDVREAGNQALEKILNGTDYSFER